jgi:hypothetical protein
MPTLRFSLLAFSALACAACALAQSNRHEPLRLEWRSPDALAQGYAALLPSNRATVLSVRVVDEVTNRDPDLVAIPDEEEFVWRLESGEGLLTPRGDGSRCRLLPQASLGEPLVVSVTLTRTYHDPGRRLFKREQTHTATLRGRIVAPISADHMDARGRIEGFQIGEYPDPYDQQLLESLGGAYDWVREHADRYDPPQWFYPVTGASRDWAISKHVRLGDFILDAPHLSLGMPQCAAIDPLLLAKLEELAEEMHDAGHAFDHWSFIYGFRSPNYNLGRIEQDQEDSLKSPFSQHMLGRAADIIVDTDGDGILDDLDGDGEITVRDAAVIMHHVNVIDRRHRATGNPRMGGAGLYAEHDYFERAAAIGQSPYVHVDVRGFTRDDGTLFRWPSIWPDSGEPIRWSEL